MIRASEDVAAGAGLFPAAARAHGWTSARPERVAFATMWCTGADPARDALVRVQALRRSRDGWESFTSHVHGFARSTRADEAEHVGARLAREYGVAAADLAHAPGPDDVLGELHAFLDGCSVVTAARRPFLSWWRARAPAPELELLDLAEVAALCLPGRLASEGEGLCRTLLGRAPSGGPRALEPTHVRAALGVLVARVLAQGEPARALLVHALDGAARALARQRGPRARALELVLALLEHPAAWRDPERQLEPEAYELRDGRLSAAARELDDLVGALDAAQPRWRQASSGERDLPAVRLAEERTLDDNDRRVIDEIFQEHLPRHFRARESAGDASGYRAGQHGVASVIAEGFGRRELRLVHAPTGTGKTLAYLVPTALWAYRNHARVGIATYTRVLQEQAMEREAPLALALLARAANAPDLRVAVLKGRENYLCWRALSLQAPLPGDPAEEQLAWAALAAFALHDPHGDLDRFGARAPLAELGEPYRRALERLLGAVRSETGCCTLASDRATCAAEAAWRTAERAHVVITNHALALARRDFFQHVVFDECEHLHDVALNAFSSSVSLRQVSETLARLDAPGDARRPLARVRAAVPLDGEFSALIEGARAAHVRARKAVTALGGECARFLAWRAARVHERSDGDQHSLFREYALEHGEELCARHAELAGALQVLLGELARLQEALDGVLPPREAPRLRRALEVLRVELEDQRAAVAAWIPRNAAGRPLFGQESFHDLERTGGGDDVLVTRVLLPHEHLGRHYYPSLAGAVLLSATTWLRGGFEAAAAYLGLARAASPAPEEEREPVPVRSFRAPEAFDYSRVLLCVPRDAPPVADKGAHLDYVARFVGYLAERTRGRMLVLFTNAEDLAAAGARLEPFFSARRLPFWWQRMRGASKEELGQLFRAEVDSVLLGLDAFWYGADFPGSTLEYLVIARLPFGVPDRYHHAQCAALGTAEQRKTIYLPRALAKFRQGFGRLMRKESDRGSVFVLDKRVLDPRHRAFLRELPVRAPASEVEEPDPLADGTSSARERLAPLVLGDSDRCLDEALAHMGMKAETRRRGLARPFAGWSLAET
jgi:Rad3-related DNA helicase